MKWILVVMYLSHGSHGVPVTMNSIPGFTSRTSCENAGRVIIESFSWRLERPDPWTYIVKGVCVEQPQ